MFDILKENYNDEEWGEFDYWWNYVDYPIYGVTVQRYGDTSKIVLSESIYGDNIPKNMNEIARILKLAKNKNPELQFIPRREY